MTSLRRAAPAKLNLYLHITSKRADGYHELDSLVAFVDVNDRLSFAESDGFDITFTGPFSSGIDDVAATSVHKAAQWLSEHCGVPARGVVQVEKNLPVAAGLGGGSADCAAALKGFAELWNVRVDWQAHATDIAFALGADVPVCLNARPAHMGGIGEQISGAPTLPPAWVVLANARVPVSTAQVYGQLDGRYLPSRRLAVDEHIETAAALADLLHSRDNSLAAPALEVAPVVGDVLIGLEATPDCLLARVSGSGGTCFGLYTDQAAADTASAQLSEHQPDWWVAAGALL